MNRIQKVLLGLLIAYLSLILITVYRYNLNYGDTIFQKSMMFGCMKTVLKIKNLEESKEKCECAIGNLTAKYSEEELRGDFEDIKAKDKNLFDNCKYSTQDSIVESDSIDTTKAYKRIDDDIVLYNEVFESDKANQLNRKGINLGIEGDNEKAEIILKEALKEEPNNPTILNNLGLTHFNRGEYNKAIAYYTQSLKVSDSTNLLAAMNLGLTYYEQMDYARALKIIDFTIKKSENDNTTKFIVYIHRLMVNLELEDCSEIQNDRKTIQKLRHNNEVGDFTEKIEMIDKMISKLCTTSVAGK